MKRRHASQEVLANEGAAVSEGIPPRPSIPPALVSSLTLWAGIAIAFPLLRTVEQEWMLILCAGALLMGAVFALCAFRIKKAMILLWMLCALSCGVLLSGASALLLYSDIESLSAHSYGTFRFRMESDASDTGFGGGGTATLFQEDGNALCVRVVFDDEEDFLRFGTSFTARMAGVTKTAGEDSWLWQQGIAGTVRISGIAPMHEAGVVPAILQVRNAAIDGLSGIDDAHAVLQALACGYGVAYDNSDAERHFTLCGLAHIVAVSGAHLVIVSALVGVILRALRLPRALCVSFQLMLMLAYLVLAGIPVSAVRAFIMAAIVQLSFFSGRRSMGLSALGVCILVMLAEDPLLGLSASFALSALSTLGICLFYPLVSGWLHRIAPIAPALFRDALALTLCSSLLAQPLSCALFSQLPLVSPLANVVVAPLVGPVCAGGILAGLICVVAPALGQPLVAVSAMGSQLLCAAASWCACLPYANIPASIDGATAVIVSGVVSAILWLAWPNPKRRLKHVRTVLAVSAGAVLIACAIWLYGSTHRETQITMLDVGQGDAILLVSQSAAVLIDTGTDDAKLKSALARQGVMHLDLVVITHGDDDHCGSLLALSDVVQIERVGVAENVLECPCQACAELRESASGAAGAEDLVGLKTGDTLSAGLIGLQVVWPESFSADGGNADSLCLYAEIPSQDGQQKYTALFVGDAEADQLGPILDNAGTDHVDVYKVGHHGSRNALTDQLAERMSPLLSLVSVGKENRYGHPAEETLAALAQAGSAIFRTDESGDVSCKFTSEGIVVETLR